jgi:hypothetical protein
VPGLVDPRRTADEGLGADDPVCELGMVAVDAGVDHRHPDGRQQWQLVPEVEGAVRREVPLARGERVGGDEREAARAEPLDVGRARKVGQPRPRRALDDDRGKWRQALRSGTERPAQRGQIGHRAGADGITGAVGGRREECSRGEHEREPAHCRSIWTERPSAKPWTGATRAR